MNNNDRPYTEKELKELERLKEAVKDAVPFFRITDCDGDESEDGHEESKQYDEMLKMIEDADRWTISADDFVDEDNKTEEKSDT